MDPNKPVVVQKASVIGEGERNIQLRDTDAVTTYLLIKVLLGDDAKQSTNFLQVEESEPDVTYDEKDGKFTIAIDENKNARISVERGFEDFINATYKMIPKSEKKDWQEFQRINESDVFMRLRSYVKIEIGKLKNKLNTSVVDDTIKYQEEDESAILGGGNRYSKRKQKNVVNPASSSSSRSSVTAAESRRSQPQQKSSQGYGKRSGGGSTKAMKSSPMRKSFRSSDKATTKDNTNGRRSSVSSSAASPRKNKNSNKNRR